MENAFTQLSYHTAERGNIGRSDQTINGVFAVCKKLMLQEVTGSQVAQLLLQPSSFLSACFKDFKVFFRIITFTCSPQKNPPRTLDFFSSSSLCTFKTLRGDAL